MKKYRIKKVFLGILLSFVAIELSLGGALLYPGMASYAAVNPLGMKSTNDKKEDTTDIQWQEITISDAKQLKELAKNCTLDTWSQDKYVKLTEDIYLAETDFQYFATFGGIFDGNGHTIDGLSITADMSYLGLFSKLQPGGVVKNLTVAGSIIPGNKQMVVGGIVGDNYGTVENCTFRGVIKGNDYTGAIAGYNETTGILINCKSYGTIMGQHYTGGIVGSNCGGVYRCTNHADVNTSNVDKGMSIEDINIDTYLNAIMDIGGQTSEGKTLDKSNSAIDTGGIVGHSTGVVEFCTNRGDVGYERVGYNVGGIAGRQSGYLHGCKNSGTILGRKDVGGIVGQAEPYIQLDLTEDIIHKLTENINELHDCVNKTLKDAGNTSDTVSDRLTLLQKFVDSALEDTSFLAGETINFVNGLTNAGNQGLGRVDYAMDEVGKSGGVMDQSKEAMDQVGKASEKLDQVVKDTDIYSYMTPDEKVRYDGAKDRIQANTEEFNGYYSTVYQNNYHYYIDQGSKTANTAKSYYGMNDDSNRTLLAYNSEDTLGSFPDAVNSEAENAISYIKHADGTTFPDTSEAEKEKKDEDLIRDASSEAETKSKAYAESKYTAAGHSKSFEADLRDDAQIMTDIVAAHQSEMTEDARNDLEAASNHLKSAAEHASSASSQTADIFQEINGREDITLPVLGDGYKARTNSFVFNMQGMSENLGFLNQELNQSGDIILQDMSDVNDSFQKIMLLFTDAMDGALDGEYVEKYEDESFEVAEECTEGTVAECINTGMVSGDLDLAGIAGTMGIEYDFDLEGDVTGNKDARLNATYKTKCVLRANKNEGRITSQKSYVAGIAGLQEMGTILYCENYGRIASNTGDYVGGIAGQSISAIRNCYSRGILSGDEYIGGIVGYGHEIYDCGAIPSIMESQSFLGAIAGEVDDEAKLRDNYFVSDTLTGIDRISYRGMAEPKTYKELMEREDIPTDFQKMKITFLVDEKIIGSKLIDYGSGLMENQYPESIVEEDYYIDWDTTIVHDVTTDMEIVGEPVLFRTTIASQPLRENKQSVILVDGKFKANQALDIRQSSDLDAVNGLDHVVECWKVTVPRDGNENHQFRLQLPEGIKNAGIWIQSGEKLRKADTTTMGMYQLFEVTGEEVSIIVVDQTTPVWVIILISAASVILAGAIAISIAGKIKTKIKNKMC